MPFIDVSLEKLTLEELLILKKRISDHLKAHHRDFLLCEGALDDTNILFDSINYLDYLFTGVIILDYNGNVSKFNTAIVKKFGKIYYNQPFKTIFYSIIKIGNLDWDGIWELMKSSMSSAAMPFSWSKVPFLSITGDQEQVNVIFQPMYYHEAFIGVIGTFDFLSEQDTNIDAQMNILEEELQKLEQFEVQYHSILNSMNDIVLLLSPTGICKFCNKQVENILKIPSETLINLPLINFVHPDDHDKLNELFDSLIMKKEVTEIEYRIKDGTDHFQTHSLRVSAIKNPNTNQIYGIMVITRDITYLKQLQTELKANLSDLLRAQEMQKNFFSTTSHELLTPLVPIKGYVDLLLNRTIIDGEQMNQALKIIKRNVERLESLTEDILAITRLRSEKTEYLKLGDFTMDDIISQTALELHPLFAELQIQFVVTGKKDIHIECDSQLLIRALSTLITNGCRYCDPNKLVKWINVNVIEKDAENIQIAVEDNGLGIDFTLMEKETIFEPFADISSSYRNKIDPKMKTLFPISYGLGLTIAKRVIDLHLGTIKVDSAGFEKGTRFEITLPKKQYQ